MIGAMMDSRGIGVLVFVSAITSSAWGQAVAPAVTVDGALQGAHPIFRRSTQYAAGEAHTWTFALPTERGHCYDVLGAATGGAHVHVEVYVRAASATPATLLSSASVSSTRFCASLPGHAYTLHVQTDGATSWSVAAREAAAAEDPGAASRERLAAALVANGVAHPSAAPSASSSPPSSPPATMAAPIAVGGTENDYVTTQIRQLVHAQGPRWSPLMAAWRWTLDASQSQEAPVALTGGHCVTAVAAGMPSVTDVNLEFADPAGNRVAQDEGHRGVESLHYCPGYSGTYRLTVRLFAGRGPVGVQVFEEH